MSCDFLSKSKLWVLGVVLGLVCGNMCVGLAAGGSGNSGSYGSYGNSGNSGNSGGSESHAMSGVASKKTKPQKNQHEADKKAAASEQDVDLEQMTAAEYCRLFANEGAPQAPQIAATGAPAKSTPAGASAKSASAGSAPAGASAKSASAGSAPAGAPAKSASAEPAPVEPAPAESAPAELTMSKLGQLRAAALRGSRVEPDDELLGMYHPILLAALAIDEPRMGQEVPWLRQWVDAACAAKYRLSFCASCALEGVFLVAKLCGADMLANTVDSIFRQKEWGHLVACSLTSQDSQVQQSSFQAQLLNSQNQNQKPLRYTPSQPQNQLAAQFGQNSANPLAAQFGQNSANPLAAQMFGQNSANPLAAQFGQNPANQLAAQFGQNPANQLAAQFGQNPANQLAAQMFGQNSANPFAAQFGQNPANQLAAQFCQNPANQLAAQMYDTTQNQLVTQMFGQNPAQNQLAAYNPLQPLSQLQGAMPTVQQPYPFPNAMLPPAISPQIPTFPMPMLY